MSMKSISKSISLMSLLFTIVNKQVEVVNASRMYSSISNFNNLLTLLNLKMVWIGVTEDVRKLFHFTQDVIFPMENIFITFHV